MLDDSLSINQFLGHESGGGQHGKTSVLKLLSLKEGELGGILRLQVQGIETNVTRDVALTKETRLVNGDILGFNPANLGTGGFSLGNSGGQDQPEDGVDLRNVGDGRAGDLTVEKGGLSLDGLTDQESNNSQHTNTSVRELGLAVSLKGGLISLGSKTKRVEKTDGVKSSGDSVQGESRGLGLGGGLGLEGVESRGRGGEKGEGGEFHFGCCSRL